MSYNNERKEETFVQTVGSAIVAIFICIAGVIYLAAAAIHTSFVFFTVGLPDKVVEHDTILEWISENDITELPNELVVPAGSPVVLETPSQMDEYVIIGVDAFIAITAFCMFVSAIRTMFSVGDGSVNALVRTIKGIFSMCLIVYLALGLMGLNEIIIRTGSMENAFGYISDHNMLPIKNKTVD